MSMIKLGDEKESLSRQPSNLSHMSLESADEEYLEYHNDDQYMEQDLRNFRIKRKKVIKGKHRHILTQSHVQDMGLEVPADESDSSRSTTPVHAVPPDASFEDVFTINNAQDNLEQTQRLLEANIEPDNISLSSQHSRHCKEPVRDTSKKMTTRPEFFTVKFGVSSDEDVEQVPAVKGLSLRDALRAVLEQHNLSVDRVNIFVEFSNTPLPLQADCFPLGGNQLIVKAKDGDSPFSRNSHSNRSTGSQSTVSTISAYSGKLDSSYASNDKQPSGNQSRRSMMGGGEEGNETSPQSTLTYTDTARIRSATRNNSKLTTLFPFSKATEKQDQLLVMLNSYSLNGLPPMPSLVAMDCRKFDPGTFDLESHWTHIVRSDPSTLGAKVKDQQEAIWELVCTEVEYIRRLRIVIDLYMCCLLHLQEHIILNEIETEKIFSNILKVYEVNCTLWEEHMLKMVQCTRSDGSQLDPTMLFDGFMQFETTFEPYSKYCCEQNVSLEYIRKKLQENELFRTFIAWAESQKLCDRLRLQDLVVIPMQRLTKYKLLIKAILKKTESEQQRTKLANMMEKVDHFVTKVNTALHQSEEKARLSAIIDRIESYDVVDAPSDEVTKLVSEFCRLDLTCPLPGCTPHQRRHLLLEGLLKLKDNNTRMDVYCFLFTDMFLISKPTKRSGNDRVKVIRAPMRLDKIVVTALRDPSSFLLICLNEYHLASAIYTLNGDSKAWLEHIKRAQESFCEMRRVALDQTENDIMYQESPDELDDEYCFISGDNEGHLDTCPDPHRFHHFNIDGSSARPGVCEGGHHLPFPQRDYQAGFDLPVSLDYNVNGEETDNEAPFGSPLVPQSTFDAYDESMYRLRALRQYQRRVSRNEKRYYTADSIQDMQKQRDSSIHKRLSWNFGGYNKMEQEHRDVFTSMDSIQSIPSSSGVSSTQSLHLTMDTDMVEAEKKPPFQTSRKSAGATEIASQHSDTGSTDSVQRRNMTHAQIIKLKKELLLNSTLETSEV